ANEEISWAWEIVPFLTFGTNSPLWVSLAIADLIVKWLIGLAALIPFRIFVSFFLLQDNKTS
ncbi:MAG: VUT family protein, partial [Paracoccaceae bacterium]